MFMLFFRNYFSVYFNIDKFLVLFALKQVGKSQKVCYSFISRSKKLEAKSGKNS